MRRIVIVGGGMTGLAAAHALEKADERFDVRSGLASAAGELSEVIGAATAEISGLQSREMHVPRDSISWNAP